MDDLISRSALEGEFRRRADTLDKELGGDLFHISEIVMVIDNAQPINPFTDPILEAYSKLTDSEFEYSNDFWIMTPKGKKIYFEKKRPQGEWIIIGEEQGALGITYKIRKCSECGWEHGLLIPNNFCPKCGAPMKGVKNA